MAIVLPHGVLFRGAAEGTIREILLENGAVYAVIGLPSNMFYNTSIPTCIVVLKKHRDGRDILFIDASTLPRQTIVPSRADSLSQHQTRFPHPLASRHREYPRCAGAGFPAKPHAGTYSCAPGCKLMAKPAWHR